MFYRDPEVLERLHPEHFKNMCNRMEVHLNASATQVGNDQAHITARMKEVGFFFTPYILLYAWFGQSLIDFFVWPFLIVFRWIMKQPSSSIHLPRNRNSIQHTRKTFPNCIMWPNNSAAVMCCSIKISKAWKFWTICWISMIDCRRFYGKHPMIESANGRQLKPIENLKL